MEVHMATVGSCTPPEFTTSYLLVLSMEVLHESARFTFSRCLVPALVIGVDVPITEIKGEVV